MGDEADGILQSFALYNEDKKIDETVKGSFEAHFVKRRTESLI